GLDASTTALIVQLEVPFLVLIGAIYLNETPGWRKWVGIGIAFLGVYYIAGQPMIASAWWSVLLVIFGGITWAAGQAMVRNLREISGLTVAAWVAILATPQLYVTSFLLETGQVRAIATAGWQVWAVVVYLGLVMTALGYFMWYTLVRRTPVSQAAPYLLTLPVFAGLGGWLILGETITAQTLLGGVIILAGVGLIVFERAPKPD
ncbi:MAG: DMT family transporter, partial [Planktomarina sp.]